MSCGGGGGPPGFPPPRRAAPRPGGGRTSGGRGAAEARLNERVAAALSDAIGRHPLPALASTDPALWRLDALTHEVLEAVAPQARDELGVDVIDVRLRRFTPPVEVRPAVFDLIRS